MKLSTRLAAGAAIVAVAAVPAAADAKPVTQKDVKSQVAAADKSLNKVVSLVKRNRDGASIVHLRDYKRHVRKATAQTRSLKRKAAKSPANAKAYAGSVKKLGLISDECADALSQIVDDVHGDTQVDFATTLQSCIVTREKLVEQLTAFLAVAPEPVKPLIAKVIALLSTQAGDDTGEVTDQLGNTELPPEIADILKDCLEIATNAIDDAQDRLSGLIDIVPPFIRPIIQEALGMVSTQIDSIQEMVSNLLQNLLGGATGLPGQGGGDQPPTTGDGGLFSHLPFFDMLKGLFGGGFPFSLDQFNLPFNIPGFGFAVR